MSAPILLLPFTDSLTGQDANGAMTATATSTVAYVDSPGGRAVRPEGTSRVTIPGTYIDPQRGAIAVRYRRHTEVSGNERYLFSLGVSSATDFFLAVRYNPTTIWTRRTESAIWASTTAPALGTWQTVYLEWTPETWGVDYGAGLTTAARSAGFVATTYASFGGYPTLTAYEALADFDGVLLLDGPSTTQERAALFGTDAWTWGMFTPDASPAIIPTTLRIGSSHIGPLRAGKA